MKNKYAQIADRCKDDNFKEIYGIFAEKAGRSQGNEDAAKSPMSFSDDELSKIDTTTGSYTGMSVTDATTTANADGFNVTVKGEGNTVLAQNPPTGASIPMGGTVVLYTDQESSSEKVAVPNFEGVSVSDANYLAAEAGVNVSLSGQVSSAESTAISQSVPEGEEVAPGTVIVVNFSTEGTID